MGTELDAAPEQLSIEVVEADIIKAFEQRQFEVLYQPQVSLSEAGKIIGAEAFVRLRHPTYGLLVPGAFLPLVSSMGKMMDLTVEVMNRVAKDWVTWNQQGHDIRVSVNIDHGLFEDKSLARTLGDAVSEMDVNKHRLTLEISQSRDGGISDIMREQITRLRMKGFRLSLDDFGSSVTIESELSDVPIDEIKIHRDIIAELRGHAKAQTAVRKALHVADKLGLRVVAVGVEREIEADWLCRQGCDSAQGYLFGKPMEFIAFTTEILTGTTQWSLQQEPNRLSLLIIEDDQQYRSLLVEALSDLYEIHVAADRQEARFLFEAHPVDLMIVDVNLPDGSGIELCKQLSLEKGNLAVTVLFISGDDLPEDRLNAYEAGGVDFIAKPFSVAELVAKIGRMAAYQTKRRQLTAQAQEVQAVAVQSMQEAAHYGDVVQFFKNLLGCRDEKDLAQELFRFMQQKGLSCSVQFRGAESISSFDQTEAVCSPIEMNVFEILRDKGRLYDFGNRTIVNDEHVSFLIKNMPSEVNEHGRVRDYVAVVIEGLEARYRDVLRQRVLETVFQQLNELAVELATVVGRDRSKQAKMLEKFSLELRMSFHVLDMTEDQEEHLTKIIEGMLRAKDENEITTSDVGEQIAHIVGVLSKAMAGLEEKSDGHEQQSAHAEVIELF